MITSPKVSAIPTCPRAFVSASTIPAPPPAKTSAKVPIASATRARASEGSRFGTRPRNSGRRGCGYGLFEEACDPIESAGLQAIEGEGSALLPLQDPGLNELLQVVAHGRLRDPERRLELTHADCVPRLQEDVEDAKPMAVAQRLEQPLELDCLVGGKRRN